MSSGVAGFLVHGSTYNRKIPSAKIFLMGLRHHHRARKPLVWPHVACVCVSSARIMLRRAWCVKLEQHLWKILESRQSSLRKKISCFLSRSVCVQLLNDDCIDSDSFGNYWSHHHRARKSIVNHHHRAKKSIVWPHVACACVCVQLNNE